MSNTSHTNHGAASHSGNSAHAAPPAPQKPMRFGLLKLMRPKQWVKNGFVLAPLIFAAKFTDTVAVKQALLAVFLFSCASSATYIFNDLGDIEKDRAHPTKRFKRPLAAGAVTPPQAWTLFAILVATVLGIGFTFAPAATAVIVGYQTLNVAYSLKLKHVPVVDIFVIAIGFVLRILAGAVAIGVPLSPWMSITTLCLALYLAATKRRQELKDQGAKARNVLQKYTVALLDDYTSLAGFGAIVFYAMYVIEDGKYPNLAFTVPLVLFGFFRYRYIVESLGDGESPTDVLWQDAPIALTVFAWLGVAAWAIFTAAPIAP